MSNNCMEIVCVESKFFTEELSNLSRWIEDCRSSFEDKDNVFGSHALRLWKDDSAFYLACDPNQFSVT